VAAGIQPSASLEFDNVGRAIQTHSPVAGLDSCRPLSNNGMRRADARCKTCPGNGAGFFVFFALAALLDGMSCLRSKPLVFRRTVMP
ncbi:putative membrane protein, partial [Bordetella avium 197N]